MNTEREFNQPFNQEIVDTDLTSEKHDLVGLENRDDLVIRREPTLLFEDQSVDGIQRQAAFCKSQFESLQKDFGVKLPHFNYVLGHNNEQKIQETPALYIVTDRIEGNSLDQIEQVGSLNLDVATQFDLAFAATIQYFRDRLSNNQDFLRDIYSIKQFSFGHTRDNPEDSVYLHDISSLSSLSQNRAIEVRVVLTQIRKTLGRVKNYLDNKQINYSMPAASQAVLELVDSCKDQIGPQFAEQLLISASL